VGYNPETSPQPAPPVEYTEPSPPMPATSLTDFTEALKELQYATTAMEKTSALKKLSHTAESKMTDIVGQTNREFRSLQAGNPDKKQFAVNGCIFRGYTRPATYKYSEEIQAKDAEVKLMKAAAKKDGSAVITKVAADIDKDKTFGLSVVPVT